METMIKAGMRPEFFYVPEAAAMYTLSVEYFVKSGMKACVTESLLRDEFPTWFGTNDLDSETYTIDYIIDRIRTRYRRNQTQEVLKQAGAMSVEDPEEALQHGISGLAQVQFDTSTKDRHEIYEEGFGLRVEQYLEREAIMANPDHEDTTGTRGYPLGFDMLTEHVWGIKPLEFAIFAGPPSRGKSWLMALLALRCAQAGVRTYYPSLENSKEMTLMRLDCLLTGIPFEGYERGLLTVTQKDRLIAARDQVEDLIQAGMLTLDCPRYRSERTIFELYSRARFSEAEIVVGDQISWVTPRDNYRGDITQQVREVSQEIADITREFGVASCWASQFNREGAAAGKGKLHQLANTTNLEQVADMVYAISANSEMEENEMMVLEILKARRGRKTQWLLDWKLSEETRLEIVREYRDE